MDARASGVYDEVTLSGMDNQVQIVVLKRIKVSGMDHEGVVYLAPGARVKSSGMDHRLEIRQRSWAELKRVIDRDFR
jgi:hypothetical protein